MVPAESSPKLAVSVREAAAMLSVSRRTIENFIAAKKLTARKLGRRTLIPVKALEALLRTDQPSPIRPTSRGAGS
jgi:excisionase family DNA binding protein